MRTEKSKTILEEDKKNKGIHKCQKVHITCNGSIKDIGKSSAELLSLPQVSVIGKRSVATLYVNKRCCHECGFNMYLNTKRVYDSQ